MRSHAMGGGASAHGTLLLTNYRLIFVPTSAVSGTSQRARSRPASLPKPHSRGSAVRSTLHSMSMEGARAAAAAAVGAATSPAGGVADSGGGGDSGGATTEAAEAQDTVNVDAGLGAHHASSSSSGSVEVDVDVILDAPDASDGADGRKFWVRQREQPPVAHTGSPRDSVWRGCIQGHDLTTSIPLGHIGAVSKAHDTDTSLDALTVSAPASHWRYHSSRGLNHATLSRLSARTFATSCLCSCHPSQCLRPRRA